MTQQQKPLAERILDEARGDEASRVRHPPDPSRVGIAVAVLTLADGREVAGHYACEYGDEDGTRAIKEWIEQCESTGVLKEGESLVFRLFCVPVSPQISLVETPNP